MKKIFLILASLLMTCLIFAQNNPPSGLSTNTASNVTCTSFSSGSAAFNFGTPPYTGRGVVYGTSTNPTISGPKVTAPAPINANAFSVNITGLTKGTKYYYRSYATNYYGTAYGPQKDITMANNAAPSNVQAYYYDLTCEMFAIQSNIFNQGCQTITDAGICFSKTNTSPTKTGANCFYRTCLPLSGGMIFGYTNVAGFSLTEYETVYYRTYATNASGTTYSSVKSVTTCQCLDVNPEDGMYDNCP
jgi:hypothetical protein